MSVATLKIEEISRPICILDYPLFLDNEDIEELINGIDYLDYSNYSDYDYCYDVKFDKGEKWKE